MSVFFLIFARLLIEMRTQYLHMADEIKSHFIDYLINKYGKTNIILGNEVMYGTHRKVADMILLYDGKTYAIEIKSDGDNYNRLDQQLQEYRKVFDHVIVITGSKHKNSVSQKVATDIGIFVYDNNRINKIRSPKRQTTLSKEEILYSINANYLNKLDNKSTTKLDADAIRQVYQKKGISVLRRLLYDYLANQLKPKFNSFLDYRGDYYTCIDALTCFSTFQILNPLHLSFNMDTHTYRNPM